MNVVDGAVVHFVNSAAHHSGTWDRFMVLIANNQFIKSAPLFAYYWYAWFYADAKQRERREIIFSAFIACFVALFVGRVLALALPFRLRPIEDPTVHFVAPYGMEVALRHWSSFPSDHAMLYTALALGIYALSRRFGIVALAYVFFVVLVPRLYLGLHFATDIAAGAVIGAIIAYVVIHYRSRSFLMGYGMRWCDLHPASFYAVTFVFLWQMATLFDDVRTLGDFSASVVRQVIVATHHAE